MKIVELDQSGPDWLKWRADGLGGSDAPTIMDENPYRCRDELLEEKLERKKVVETEAMRRGKRLEPVARLRYMQMTGIRVRPVCVINDEHPWLRASLDGLSEDHQVVLEIKCPTRPQNHRYVLDRHEVPHYYRAQVQHQLAVTGCQVLHFFSFTDSDAFKPEEQCALVKVLPDAEYIARLIARGRKFWEQLQRERNG